MVKDFGICFFFQSFLFFLTLVEARLDGDGFGFISKKAARIGLIRIALLETEVNQRISTKKYPNLDTSFTFFVLFIVLYFTYLTLDMSPINSKFVTFLLVL